MFVRLYEFILRQKNTRTFLMTKNFLNEQILKRQRRKISTALSVISIEHLKTLEGHIFSIRFQFLLLDVKRVAVMTRIT